MPTIYECLQFGLLATNNDGIDREKCIVLSKTVAGAVTKPDSESLEDNDLCKSLCASCGCKFIEPVFPGDYTPLYVSTQSDADSITFEVRKKDGQGQIITNQDLGEFIENEKFVADWNLIRNVYGSGTYNLIINYNVIGVQYSVTSHDFRLTPFDSCLAEGWVKFIYTLNGSILDGRNFEEERIYEVRLPGFIVEQTPETETNTYQNNEREIKDIQIKVKRQYKFISKLLRYEQKEMIIKNLLLADAFTVTNYSVDTKEFKNKVLKLENIETLDDKQGSNYYRVELLFTDLKQNLIKRPC